ncbi:MAG: transcription-repair coupling factor [Microvirga sp.]
MLALHLLDHWEKSGRDGLVFLCDDESRAERLGGVIHALDPSVDVLVFPRLNTLPFDGLEPSREIAGRRSSVLRRLAKAKKPVFLVSTAEAIMERLPLPASWSRSSLTLKAGAPYSESELETRLEALGYDLDEEAEYPGGVLFHGKTFEVFPAGALAPFRIEHSGDTIRKIVAVDPIEHEVVYETAELIIDPMSERIALGATRGQRATLPDYCSRARWIADAGVSTHAESWLSTIEDAAGRRDAEREYLGQADWKQLKKRISVLPRKAAFISTPEFSKLASPRKALRAFVADMQRGGSRLLFVAAVEDDLRAMERMSGIKAERLADWSEVAKARSRDGALLADFDAGFIGGGRKPLVVVTASDVLGSRAHHPQPMARAWNPAFDHPDVPEKGAAIVHLQRGLAVLDGLQTLDMGKGSRREMIRLKFAGDNAVLVPPSDLAVIWPYAGEPGKLTLDKADGSSWWARRTEAEAEIQVAAKALAKHISQRLRRRAPKLVPPGPAYEKFVARFPYFTTVDQAQAIQDVLDDLAAGHPMDRVICGDVGFGKTEVALRAAFATAIAGKQVAVIVPTTLLARQHYRTFQERFRGLPIEIAHASRFVPAAEMKKVKAGLADGTIDIVVGTHALLGKTVTFRDLARVVVDEEQHFGVAHKERLKELRAEVHVLTLSATPIPRTLQLALTGVRELSLITTPPVDRLAVRTFVTPFDPLIIREALLRERYRGGQAFYVVPRIEDIAEVRTFLERQVPEAKVAVAHGQMASGQLEDVMTAFYEGKFDVLLSTTIIESGLDIPTANTLVVHRADMFGLSQLYQLRGRVGRAKTRAYALFTVPANRTLTVQAERRLKVLQSLDTLGAGFQLASHDLDIRGAGNLLGDEQSGHIKEVGYELYQQMLEEAVSALKAGVEEPAEDQWSPTIAVGTPVMIPEAYVPDLQLRLTLYRRLSTVETDQEIDAFGAEMVDRFGPLPDEVGHLLKIMAIKVLCRRANVDKVEAGPKGVIVSFRDGAFANPAGLVAYIAEQASFAKVRPDMKVVFTRDVEGLDERLKATTGILRSLVRIAERKQAA